MSSRHVLKMSSRSLQDMSSRRLNLQIFRPPKRFEDVFKTSSRRLQEVLEDEKLLRCRRLEDQQMLAGVYAIWQSLKKSAHAGTIWNELEQTGTTQNKPE